ncbi:hypothetical protein [Nocardia asteroides]
MISDPQLVRELLHTAPMPPVPQASALGIAWLRAHVPRFCDGPAHRHRRAAVQRELDHLDPAALRASAAARAGQPLAHVRVLLNALGLPEDAAGTVATIAAAYQPHEPITPAADTAVAGLVALCRATPSSLRTGSRVDVGDRAADHLPEGRGLGDEEEWVAARICLLVQACAATGELITAARKSTEGTPGDRPARVMATTPPLRSTRRLVDGAVIELDLRHPGLGFGAGPHRCPGGDHALAIASGVLESQRSH